MTIPRIRFSKLRRLHFIDSNELDIGSLEDVVLNQKTLEPTHLILGAGFFEELMEELGNKDNIDELAPFGIIQEIDGDYVILKQPVEELQTTDPKGKLPIKHGIKYSDLLKLEIHDKNGKYDAVLIDIELEGGKSSLVFNIEKLRLILQNDGYSQRFEVSIPISQIEFKKKRIKLPSSEEYLIELVKTTIEPKMKGKSLLYWK